MKRIQQITEYKFKPECVFSAEERLKFKEFLLEFRDIFAVNPKNPGITSAVKHTIDTGNTRPIKDRMRKVSQVEDQVINKEVKEMHQNKIIRPSKSAWASPVVLVRKPDGSIRFCVDYRKLNSVTKKDVYPLPRMDDILERLAGKKMFTTLDMASGYWQIEIDEKDKEKTAFICSAGLYEYNVMPFGLCNAPATFQRMMDNLLQDLNWEAGRDYIDDIIIGSNKFEDHIQDLRNLFVKIRQVNLKIKLSKCTFGVAKALYLGHELSEQGIAPNPQKIEAIERMKPPVDLKGLRTFLGMTSYYRKFIYRYAHVAEPLNKLLRGGTVYRWNEDCQKAFEDLKTRLKTAPILVHPNFEKEFILETDASDFWTWSSSIANR